MASSSGGDSLFLEDFGQKVDLTRRIREVLANYPEGTTVLKELVQNADDAGATKIRLCLDRRAHGVDALLAENLAQWQGPALLAYNDSVFSEDDFVSISRIGDSKKQGQAWKTGRFGVGFNSVYHMTDVPSFVSGKYVVLFDPLGVYLPNVSAANPGKRLDYVNSAAISIYRDQFLPYCAFGCDMRRPFNGTLFRFPLRNADQAARSKLSRQVYSDCDIISMFNQFCEESVFTLLFLKAITSIEMYVWDAGADEPQKIYSCFVESPTTDMVYHRQAILRLSKSETSSSDQTDSFSLDFSRERLVGVNLQKRTDKFFIVHAMASSFSRIGKFTAAAAKEHDLHLLPWASVAACITDPLVEGVSFRDGRAFCFLPLPIRTRLSVQVNGYFELSSNRRNIWFGSDMDRGGKFRSDWNMLLLEDVVTVAFNELLLGVRKLLGPSETYYSLWPVGSFEEPWNFLVQRIYQNISILPVVYSDFNGGNWLPLSQGFIHDREFAKSKVLYDTLILLEMPVVCLPTSVVDMLFKYTAGINQRLVCPGIVRQFLKQHMCLTILSRDHKLALLDYCLDDLIDADVGKLAQGLPLVPLASGEFGVFSEFNGVPSYLICNELEYKFLGQIGDVLVDRNIPPDIFCRLSNIAKTVETNIGLFTPKYFVHFFYRFMPADWKFQDIVVWDPDNNLSHPRSCWFALFWQYLQDRCDDLSIFYEWPILPLLSGHLCRVSRTSKLINTENLSGTLKDLLVKIGGKVLNPEYNVQHPQLKLYIHDTDAAGVIDALFDAVGSSHDHLLAGFQHFGAAEKDELRTYLLDPKWYIGGRITESHIKKCQKIPMYRVYTYDEESTDHLFMFSDLERPRKFLPPVGVLDCFLGDEFIKCCSNIEEEILSRYYVIQRMEKALFYKQKVLTQIGQLLPDVRNAVLLSVLQELPQLCVQDPSFRETLRSLEFVPTLSGTLKCPRVLYDPRNDELYFLLEDSDSFPCGIFQDSEVLDMLQSLGLKTIVSPDTILESARQIELMMHSDPLKACSRGKVLLSYLEVNANKWLPDLLVDNSLLINKMLSKVAMTFKSSSISEETNLAKFWNHLRMICWCPVMVNPPYSALPWPSATSTVAPPKLVRLQTDLWLVSASMRILDGLCSSTALSIGLGWSSPPGGNIIAAQLLELGKNNEHVSDQFLRQELALAMPRIYSILMGMIGTDDMDIARAILEGSRWIWVGDGFATADEVVLSGPLHLAPYVRVIPTDLAVFSSFFLEVGIREVLKPSDFSNILSRMATKNAGTSLNQKELRAALLMVQHLAEAQFPDVKAVTYLPDVSSRLILASDLVYNDAPWLLGDGSDVAGKDSMCVTVKSKLYNFVHSSISNDVAERLGVRSLRRILLAESADSMNLSLSDVAEAFGQHEALTTRLKHILEMYADGPGILFELVQNADDAGASEVAFLLDRTQYGTSSILSPEMADWQGPALYCFNNSVFSAQDLHAISRIGQDSKFEKPFTIGRFGLGFNSVYHFTDIPGFVSGENIVIFDPHACNLPGISPAHPGLRIRFVGRSILEQFPDQFSPFMQFGCNLKHPFPGTLFRFALRNKSAAARSLIKQESYTSEDVCSLFSSFAEEVVETLLFLRNVKTISIFVKDGPGHEMLLFHRVSRQVIQQSKGEPHLSYPLLDFIHGNQQSRLDKVQFYDRLSKMMDSDLPWNCQKIVLTEQTSHENKLHFWMLSECLGGGHARAKSLSSENRTRNFVPWASVAAYLHSCDRKNLEDGQVAEGEADDSLLDQFQLPPSSLQRMRKFEGRAFCFLPLPINTGLPVHVNSYFELSSNRRDIWFGRDMTGGGKIRSDWNISLLEDVTAPAYGYMLAELAKELGPCDLYFSLWPTKVGTEPWVSMVRKFYSCITSLELSVLYSKVRGGQWISAKQSVFPDYTFPEADELSEVLSEIGLPILILPHPVVERFMESCPALHFLTPQLLRTLLIRRPRGFKDRKAMILTLKYCLSDIKEPMSCEKLHGLPLLPLANGQVTVFSKSGQGERVFVTSQDEYGILNDFVPNLLVDRSISDEILKKLKSIAQYGDSNISLLTCQLLEGLFTKILPSEWENAKQVLWDPGHQGQPSMEWMKMLWNYLKSSCNDLSLFAKWPILPARNGYLLLLVKHSNVIKDDGWSENMYLLLQKVGCTFLRSDLGIDHPQLSEFVQNASASGVLDAFFAVSGDLQNVEGLLDGSSDGERRELRSFLLQSKWFQGDQMKPLHIDMIRSLPLFETYRSRKFVRLDNPTKWLSPEGLHEDLMDDNFVRSDSDTENVILKSHLCVREPTKSEFYKENLLNRMSDFILHPLILDVIFRDISLLIEDDSSTKLVLSETPFILSANRSWETPTRLYDPRIPGLQKLLDGGTFFPCEEFLKADFLDTLVSLGLKRTLGFTGLLDSARSVSLSTSDVEVCYSGRRLLALLDAFPFELDKMKDNRDDNKFDHLDSLCEADHLSTLGHASSGKTKEVPSNELDLDILSFIKDIVHDQPDQAFWSELRKISWCPVYLDPPVEGLPWSASKIQVAPPNVVRPKSQMWLVSLTMRILNGECYSEYLQYHLGWLELPDINVLSSQLVEISKLYRQGKMQSYGKGQSASALLQEEIQTLYSKLQQYIGSSDFEVLKSAVDGIPWVWTGDNFVLASALAFDSPVTYHPYLYAVPSELSRFRDLLSSLGVKDTFDPVDYVRVLRSLQRDMNGSPLSDEGLSFVRCVLEVVADYSSDKLLVDTIMSSVPVPDSTGLLTCAADLFYNDAPWMDKIVLDTRQLVHPTISNDLAGRLGLQSLRFMSLVNEEMTRDLPCMDFDKVREFLELYGDDKLLLFDLLELADCCKARKLHVILDTRNHPKQSLLQHNLGEFQGPAVIVVLEGATLNMEEICNLHLLPPWKLEGTTLNYGLGLLGCYWITDLPFIASCGSLYMFDPRGLVLSPSNSPCGKMYSLMGNNLMERFHDQFQPMFINKEFSCSSSDSTIIRMPLSLQCLSEGLESAYERIRSIFQSFRTRASTCLLFLKSVLQVSLSTWEESSLHPSPEFSVYVHPSSAALRNPFPEKKWRKFQISRLFNSSNAATKMQTIDICLSHGETEVIDRWLVVLSLGSGQTRNMALDRRYLSYNLTPVAGVAALISQNGKPVSLYSSSCILSPLPLSGSINMPVTVLGCFLVCHNGGRYLFKYQEDPALNNLQLDIGNHLIAKWNNELMLCIRDSYVEMILEFQRLKMDPSTSLLDSSSAHSLSLILRSYTDYVYSFWPRSLASPSSPEHSSSKSLGATEADWQCLIKQVIQPFYARLADQPVWQLYSGSVVKAEEGMFLSQPGSGQGDRFPITAIYGFIKEHYPVFSVPWDLVREIQAVGISVKEIKPKMVRDLLKASSTSVVLRSVEIYVDVLDYSLCDVNVDQLSSSTGAEEPGERTTLQHMNMDQLPGTSYSRRYFGASSRNINFSHSHRTTIQGTNGSGDPFDMVTNFGKALLDFGRGVVEDIGRTGNFSVHQESISSIASELKGLPFPTATKHLVKLGASELWLGNKDQVQLMLPLAARFIHPHCFERPTLTTFFSDKTVQRSLKLQPFSPPLLSNHLRLIFGDQWAAYVMERCRDSWVPWGGSTESVIGGPSCEWIQLFWKNFSGSSFDLSPFSDWPLIPAFLFRPILCRVKEHRLVFIPPITEEAIPDSGPSLRGNDELDFSSAVITEKYGEAFEKTKLRYPWLLSLMNHCGVPVYDMPFLRYGAPDCCFPELGQSLGKAIASKLVAAKNAGYFSQPVAIGDASQDELFSLFALDFTSHSSTYTSEELGLLKMLPMFKTVMGTYVDLLGQEVFVISSDAFFQPHDARCLSQSVSSSGSHLLTAIGVRELHNRDILVKFALTGFEGKSEHDQEYILMYIYINWGELQSDAAVLASLSETKFVQSADENSTELFRPKDLFDPSDPLLKSVFSEEKNKFPGGKFAADGWLRILKKAGLQAVPQPEVMLECARKVELLGSKPAKVVENCFAFESNLSTSQSGISAETWTLAGTVVEAILQNFSVLYGNNFCSSLSSIAFVPTEMGLPSIDGKKGGEKVLSSYGNSILLKDWPLAWSCMPIIARQSFLPPEFSWGALHLRSPPSFPMVLKHLQIVGRNSGEDTLARWPRSPGMLSIEEASDEVLKYLDKIWDSLSASDIIELKKVAFIPVANGTRLVTANCLFVHLSINLSPLAFELPAIYLPFVKILKVLGLQELFSVTCAKGLLVRIQKFCGYHSLNPNEFRAVLEILQFICTVAVQPMSEESKNVLDDAIIPDDGRRLVLAGSCVYVDPCGSRLISSIDTSRLRFVHPEIPERICECLGVKKLSDVIIEELDQQQPLQFVDHIGTVSLDMVKDKIHGPSFQAAVWSVIHGSKDYVAAAKDMTQEQISSLLNYTAEKLQFVHSIYTRFLLLPNLLDVTHPREYNIYGWDNRHGHRVLYFMNKSKTFVLVAETPSFLSVLDIIAIVISEALGVPTGLPIGPLLSAPESTLNSILYTLKLGYEEQKFDYGGSQRLLGKEIMPQDALQVQFHPLRPFYAGEFVAYRAKEHEKLKYGRVPENMRPSAGQALYRLLVETAPSETQMLLSSQIFSFKSISAADENMNHESTQSATEGKNQMQVPEMVPRKTVGTSKDLQHGRVSATELVQAVQDMLSAVGMPMDVEKQTLLQTTLSLQEHLRESQAALLLEQERADTASKEAETAKAAWSCRICLSSEVDTMIVPCGHVLCHKCSSAVARCPFCRLQVSKALRIYRP